MNPEGNTTLSAIKAYNGYHPCHKVLWINPAANITFSVITLETAGIRSVNLDVRIPAVSGVITEKVMLAAGFIQSTLWHG